MNSISPDPTPLKEPRPAPRLVILMPCYNEEKVLDISYPIISGLLQRMKQAGIVRDDSFLLYCDDGSRDRTWPMLMALHERHPADTGIIRLAHNRGQQAALLCGLMSVKNIADAVVTIDVDIQDDPEAIIKMVEKYRMGADIVYGVRDSRETDSAGKRISARAFYKFQNMLGLETLYDHSDFRLMDRKCLDILSEYDERNLYLRGIMPQIGLETAIVKYDRRARLAGETKYSLGKMLSLSIDGVTSFTAKPMRLIFIIGLVLMLAVFGVAIWVLVEHFLHKTITGWSSLMLSIWFLGGLILMSIGIVGEYIGKIFVEVKRRPRYNIREKEMPR